MVLRLQNRIRKGKATNVDKKFLQLSMIIFWSSVAMLIIWAIHQIMLIRRGTFQPLFTGPLRGKEEALAEEIIAYEGDDMEQHHPKYLQDDDVHRGQGDTSKYDNETEDIVKDGDSGKIGNKATRNDKNTGSNDLEVKTHDKNHEERYEKLPNLIFNEDLEQKQNEVKENARKKQREKDQQVIYKEDKHNDLDNHQQKKDGAMDEGIQQVLKTRKGHATWPKTSFNYNPNITQRIVVLGTGPTGIGAVYRLHERGIYNTNTQVIVLEANKEVGGLASSYRDDKGFLWDNGIHCVFSHYPYFDRMYDIHVPESNVIERAAFAFMMGSSGNRTFIPFPIQDNVLHLDQKEREIIMEEISSLEKSLEGRKELPNNLDEWLLQHFGKELSNVFMRKCNKKIWTVNTTEMNAIWIGERVAVPSIDKIKNNFRSNSDSQWGPNRHFKFPVHGGTGFFWKKMKEALPTSWFHFEHKAVSMDLKAKILQVVVEDNPDSLYELSFDALINTAPLDKLLAMESSGDFEKEKSAAQQLVHSIVHIVGIGLKGELPNMLKGKTWVYFPDADSPFYRVTPFSIYSNDHVPHPGSEWSLMVEISEPYKNEVNNNISMTPNEVIVKTIKSLVLYGFIQEDQIISKYHKKLPHGYPVPSKSREEHLKVIQEMLEKHNVYSRGRFGGWRCEVSNQDHLLMQGVEAVDYIIKGIQEDTYRDPNFVNNLQASNRILENDDHYTDTSESNVEVVIAHYVENMADVYKNHCENKLYGCHLYTKSGAVIPDFSFKQYHKLENVGKEAHTYLYHIIKNYDRLKNITVFIRDDFRSCHKNATLEIDQYIEKAKRLGYAVEINPSVKEGNWNDSYSNEAIKGFWNITLPELELQKYNYTLVKCFAVSRKLIKRIPKTTYERILNYVSHDQTLIDGNILETLWSVIFTHMG